MKMIGRGWKRSVAWPVLLAGFWGRGGGEAGFGVGGGAKQFSMEHATPQQLAGIAKDNSRHFGDDPDDGGPIATELSASLDPATVGKAMRKVGDWQLARSQEHFDRIWTWSVLYSGFMAASDSLGDAKDGDASEAR